MYEVHLMKVYENLSPEMEARNITFRNSIVPNAMSALHSSGDFFVSRLRTIVLIESVHACTDYWCMSVLFTVSR
jgi:hypothetical protein